MHLKLVTYCETCQCHRKSLRKRLAEATQRADEAEHRVETATSELHLKYESLMEVGDTVKLAYGCSH